MLAERTRTILLVEDNPDHAALAMRALHAGSVGGTVVHVTDGAQARDYLFGVGAYAGRDGADIPALILLDLELPEIGGLDLLRRIRAHDRTRRIPVVVLGSSEDDEDVVRGQGLGVNSFVRKREDADGFTEALRDLSIYWLLVTQPFQEPTEPD